MPVPAHLAAKYLHITAAEAEDISNAYEQLLQLNPKPWQGVSPLAGAVVAYRIQGSLRLALVERASRDAGAACGTDGPPPILQLKLAKLKKQRQVSNVLQQHWPELVEDQGAVAALEQLVQRHPQGLGTVKQVTATTLRLSHLRTCADILQRLQGHSPAVYSKLPVLLPYLTSNATATPTAAAHMARLPAPVVAAAWIGLVALAKVPPSYGQTAAQVGALLQQVQQLLVCQPSSTAAPRQQQGSSPGAAQDRRAPQVVRVAPAAVAPAAVAEAGVAADTDAAAGHGGGAALSTDQARGHATGLAQAQALQPAATPAQEVAGRQMAPTADRRKRKLSLLHGNGAGEFETSAAGSVGDALPKGGSVAARASQGFAMVQEVSGGGGVDGRADKKQKTAADQQPLGRQQQQQQAGLVIQETAEKAAAAGTVGPLSDGSTQHQTGCTPQMAKQSQHRADQKQQGQQHQLLMVTQQHQQQEEGKGQVVAKAPAAQQLRLPRSLRRLRLPHDLSDTRRAQLQEAGLVLLVLRELHQAASVSAAAAAAEEGGGGGEEQERIESLTSPLPQQQEQQQQQTQPHITAHVVPVEHLQLPAALLAGSGTSSDAGGAADVSSTADIIDAWCQGTLVRCDASGNTPSGDMQSSSCASCVRLDAHFRRQLLRHAVLKEVRQAWLSQLAVGDGEQGAVHAQPAHTLLEKCRAVGLTVYVQLHGSVARLAADLLHPEYVVWQPAGASDHNRDLILPAGQQPQGHRSSQGSASKAAGATTAVGTEQVATAAAGAGAYERPPRQNGSSTADDLAGAQAGQLHWQPLQPSSAALALFGGQEKGCASAAAAGMERLGSGTSGLLSSFSMCDSKGTSSPSATEQLQGDNSHSHLSLSAAGSLPKQDADLRMAPTAVVGTVAVAVAAVAVAAAAPSDSVAMRDCSDEDLQDPGSPAPLLDPPVISRPRASAAAVPTLPPGSVHSLANQQAGNRAGRTPAPATPTAAGQAWSVRHAEKAGTEHKLKRQQQQQQQQQEEPQQEKRQHHQEAKQQQQKGGGGHSHRGDRHHGRSSGHSSSPARDAAGAKSSRPTQQGGVGNSRPPQPAAKRLKSRVSSVPPQEPPHAELSPGLGAVPARGARLFKGEHNQTYLLCAFEAGLVLALQRRQFLVYQELDALVPRGLMHFKSPPGTLGAWQPTLEKWGMLSPNFLLRNIKGSLRLLLAPGWQEQQAGQGVAVTAAEQAEARLTMPVIVPPGAGPSELLLDAFGAGLRAALQHVRQGYLRLTQLADLLPCGLLQVPFLDPLELEDRLRSWGVLQRHHLTFKQVGSLPTLQLMTGI